MSVFTERELDYLSERQLGRIATVGNPEQDSIDVGGTDFAKTKKFRDARRSGRASIVVDDLVSTDPWKPRGIEVRGRAEAIDGEQPLVRIHPERVVSWGIESDRLGERFSRAIEPSHP